MTNLFLDELSIIARREIEESLLFIADEFELLGDWCFDESPEWQIDRLEVSERLGWGFLT